MVHENLALVTGANGHLGNNLVRLLIDKNVPVRASVRNIKTRELFKDLNCEIVQADITDKQSLINALRVLKYCTLLRRPLSFGRKTLKKKFMR